MKSSKITLLALSVIILFALVGYNNFANNATAVFIDEYEWEISTIQAGEDGAVIACSKEKKTTYDSAVEIDMSCTAKNGILRLTDTTNGNTYEGTYEQAENSKEATIHEITLVEESGNAVSSMTVYQDENKAPTLIISIADYVLTFFSNGESTQGSAPDTTITTEPLFMVNGKLYYGTDEVGPMGDSGVVEGKIVSSVGSNEIPLQNAESNFGCIGNPYTYDFGDDRIMLLMDDDEYHFFYVKD